MAKSTLLIILFFISSCANLSKNQVISEQFSIRGGKFSSQTWDDSLKFDRKSWYAELTLIYDLLLTGIDDQSPFWRWLSVSEKHSLSSCRKQYIAIAYSQDSKKVSHTMFKNFAKEAGYSSIALPQFSNYLNLHPDFNQNSFHLYKVFGLCLDDPSPKRESIALQFPNFTEVFIK